MIVLGARRLLAFEMVPGPTVATAECLPPGLETGLSRSLPTLVMFAHPQCPCTAASLRELALLLARTEQSIEAHVVFLTPESATADWHSAPLWKQAAFIPGVVVHEDCGGQIAARFGVSTSGHVLLYDRHGIRVFSGGITAARGHDGDNTGYDALSSLLRGDAPRVAQTPVYGCSLF
jgi:hypothetical protein